MTYELYRLPDGRIVHIDATASKGAPGVTFELKAEPGQLRGTVVIATRVAGSK